MTNIALPPYAQTMGMRFAGDERGSPVVTMDFAPHAMGRPGFFHGGAISGVLEVAGFAALAAELDRQNTPARIRPINISVEFLRGGIEEPIFACDSVLRAGRRVANVQVEAWQSDRSRPIASCWMNFQLTAR